MQPQDRERVVQALIEEMDRVAAEAAAAREYADLAVRRVVRTAAALGISQRTIAAHLRRSQPEVHRILRRAEQATATSPRNDPVRRLRREERVAYELHRTVAAKLATDPGGLRTLARTNLTRMRDLVRGRQAREWLDEWERLAEGPTEDLVATMLRIDEHGTDMRQVSPFAGALSEVERLAAIERASADAA